jgi:TPR repeat protein
VAEAAADLACRHELGDAAAPDEARALQLFAEACAAGNEAACGAERWIRGGGARPPAMCVPFLPPSR